METETESEIVWLRHDMDMSEDAFTAVGAALFGALLDKADGTVKHYRSDFYHDANWVRETVERMQRDGRTEETIFFGFRDTGTAIGFSDDAVRYSNTHVYRIELARNDRGKWTATFTAI